MPIKLASAHEKDRHEITVTITDGAARPAAVVLDERLPLARRLHEIITERFDLLEETDRRAIARWLLYFVEAPNENLHERLISYIDQLERETLAGLFPSHGDYDITMRALAEHLGPR